MFSDLLIDRRIKLAGHILRSNDNDPLRRVSYEPNSAVTSDVGKRRVGGPRQQWTQYSNKYAWENALGKGRYENTAQQNQELLNCARSRQFWKPIASACPRFHPYANTGMKPWLRKKGFPWWKSMGRFSLVLLGESLKKQRLLLCYGQEKNREIPRVRSCLWMTFKSSVLEL